MWCKVIVFRERDSEEEDGWGAGWMREVVKGDEAVFLSFFSGEGEGGGGEWSHNLRTLHLHVPVYCFCLICFFLNVVCFLLDSTTTSRFVLVGHNISRASVCITFVNPYTYNRNFRLMRFALSV